MLKLLGRQKQRYDKDVLRNGQNTIFTATAWGNLITNSMDYGHMKAKSLILFGPSSNPHPKYSFGIGILDTYYFVEKWKTWTRNSLYQNGC